MNQNQFLISKVYHTTQMLSNLSPLTGRLSFAFLSPFFHLFIIFLSPLLQPVHYLLKTLRLLCMAVLAGCSRSVPRAGRRCAFPAAAFWSFHYIKTIDLYGLSFDNSLGGKLKKCLIRVQKCPQISLPERKMSANRPAGEENVRRPACRRENVTKPACRRGKCP
jgi:hypothetical protein